MTTYAVIMQYPGDGLLEENRVEFFTSLDRAVRYRDGRRDETFKVFRVEPVSESALWDWGTRKVGTDDEPTVYVNERAARVCCYSVLEVVKRRRGTTTWIPAVEAVAR